jgi:hypothetical protein
MTQTFDLASAAYARWKRAVDLLIREVVARRRTQAQASAENARTLRRVRNLRRIVRKALSEYSRLQMLKSSRESGVGESGVVDQATPLTISAAPFAAPENQRRLG